jgi:signal transduction histidine kinase
VTGEPVLRGRRARLAWEADCLERERREARIVLAFGGVLIPAWALFDLLLEPQLARPFALLRTVGTAACWGAFVALRGERSLARVRAVVGGAVALAGATIAVMLPAVRNFSAYLFGFSLCFWAPGALLSWRVRHALGLSAWLLAVAAAAFALWPGRGLADLVTAGFYLASAAVVSTGMTFAHRRAMYRAFEASHLLERRNAELERALERLGDAQARLVSSEKLSAVGRLLAGLSHEINNPLNVLHNNVEPLREHLARLVDAARVAGAGDPAELAALRARWAELDLDWITADSLDAIDASRVAVDRIRQIQRDLRVFVRGDAPEMVLADVNEGIRATAALLARRLPDGAALSVDLSPLPPIRCHPGQLNQVWHNLLQNGLDAIGERGAVTVSSRLAGDRIEVAVVDTGPGIAPEHRARLFEPFFTTKDVGKGTGLGLATSYQIVQRHGGAFALDPTHAGGARFVVELPVAAT